MKKLLLWLLPPAGFVCGWLLGMDNSASSRQPVINPGAAVSRETLAPSALQKDVPLPDTPVSPHKAVPLVTLREVLSYSSEMHRLGAFLRLLDNATPEQFASIHAELLALEILPDDSFIRFFFRHWAQVAPEMAVEAALANRKRDKGGWLNAALVTWAERDPVAALAYVQKLPSKQGIAVANLQALAVPKPGELPPQEAVRRIHAIHGAGEPSLAMVDAAGAIFREWAKTDPEAAWREALALSEGGGQLGLRTWALSRVIESQAATDPEAAAKLIEMLPQGSERADLQASYVASLVWGKQRSLAKTYALAMPDGPDRQKAISSLANTLIRVDQDEATALVAGLPASDLQDPSMFTDFFRVWLATDPQRAREVLLAHIPADIQATPGQRAAYDEMFFMSAGREPRANSEFLLKLPESVRRNALENAVGNFCSVNPVEAGKWAANLPPGPDRDAVMQMVGTNLAREGVTEVTNWLNQLPPDSGKFAAIEGFARKIISISPDDALAWLRSEPDEAARLERLKRVWSSWKDRAAAEKWRDSSSELSVAERAALK